MRRGAAYERLLRVRRKALSSILAERVGLVTLRAQLRSSLWDKSRTAFPACESRSPQPRGTLGLSPVRARLREGGAREAGKSYVVLFFSIDKSMLCLTILMNMRGVIG